MGQDATVRAFVSTGDNRGAYQDVAVRIGAGAMTGGLANDIVDFLEDGLLVHGTLAVDSTAEKFQTTTACAAMIGGLAVAKSAATAIAFSAAHPVTASKFGAILIQMDIEGTVTTLIGETTQTTTQAYASAALAIAALPDAAADNVALGYVIIEADGGGWVAITDDLTDASDLTTAVFVDGTPKTLPSNI